jgi:hypothetical protein
MEIMRTEWEHMRQEEQQQLLATQADADNQDASTTDGPAE